LDEFNAKRKRDLIEEMQKVREEQREEKRLQEKTIKNLNSDFAKSINLKFNEFVKEKQDFQTKKKIQILNYKSELDKQIEGKM